MPRYFQPAQPKPGWQRAYRNSGSAASAADDGSEAVASPAEQKNSSPGKSTIQGVTQALAASPTAVKHGTSPKALRVTDSLGWLTTEAPPMSAPAAADPTSTIILRLEEENERLNLQLQDLKQVMDTMSKASEDFRSTIQRLEFRNKELEVQLANAESAKKRGLSDLQGLLKQREAVLADCQLEIRRRKQEALNMDQQMRENSVTIQHLQGRIVALEEENASLRMSTYKLRLEAAEKVIDKQKEEYSVYTAELEQQLAMERNKNERLLAERSKIMDHSSFPRRMSTPAQNQQPERHRSSYLKATSHSGSSAPKVSPKEYVSPSWAHTQTTPSAARVQQNSLLEEEYDEDFTPHKKTSLPSRSSTKKSRVSVLEDIRSPAPSNEERRVKNDSHRKRLRTRDPAPDAAPRRLDHELLSLHRSNAKYQIDTLNTPSSPALVRRSAGASKRRTNAAPSNEAFDSLAILDQISSPRPPSVKKAKKARIKFLSDSSSEESL